MATVLKVNRDWERIADLAVRMARRAESSRAPPAVWPCPSRSSNWLAMSGPGSLLFECPGEGRLRRGPGRDRRRQHDRRRYRLFEENSRPR